MKKLFEECDEVGILEKMFGKRGNDICDVWFVSSVGNDLDVVHVKTFEELDDFWVGLHGFG